MVEGAEKAENAESAENAAAAENSGNISNNDNPGRSKKDKTAKSAKPDDEESAEDSASANNASESAEPAGTEDQTEKPEINAVKREVLQFVAEFGKGRFALRAWKRPFRQVRQGFPQGAWLYLNEKACG